MSIVWDERGGATVMRDGHAQSYVDPDDPLLLVFEYVEQIGLVLQALRPDPAPLATTHVGGGGLTLARWIHRVHPGSPQIVLEPDVALTELVRRELPLPRGHRIRVRPVSGEEGITTLREGSAEVVVQDAYAEGQVPARLTGTWWAGQVARILAPGGLLVVNAADEPGLRWLARFTATLRTALPHVGLLVLREVAKGRRYGNVVVVASDRPLDDVSLTRVAARATFPTTWRTSADTARTEAGVQPFGPDGQPSPPPPDSGVLRLR
ncbi:spermidine synthase [Ornithinimicrobium sufpigmenti]|uniref:spermidine synthase n=1 Tax=Ornithinimicrobium sufpigmenti TaxID=2508882 RepID=UPI0010364FDD|nr:MULTISPECIES: fused MFS/spermidine synthase [unclassified Ornithinimicrobium]